MAQVGNSRKESRFWNIKSQNVRLPEHKIISASKRASQYNVVALCAAIFCLASRASAGGKNDSHCDGSGWAQSKKSSASGIQNRKMFQACLHNKAAELRCHLLPGFESLSPRQNDSHCDGSSRESLYFFSSLAFFLKYLRNKKLC